MFNMLKCCFLWISFEYCRTDELVYTHVVYRHGDRSPASTFPTDVYQKSFWPQGWGELTNLGKRQHYKLGQWLKNTYAGKLISENYTVSEFYARSSDKDRTLQSAASNLAALYPPAKEQIWDASVPVANQWQPIPIHTVPLDEDILLEPGLPCPNWDIVYSEQSQGTIDKINAEFQEFYKFLENVTGLPEINLGSIGKVYDPLNCEMCHNLTVPYWVNAIYNQTLNVTVWEIIENLKQISNNLVYNTPEKSRLQSGYLMGVIATRMLNVTQGIQNDAEKFVMYSGHDGTVAGLLYLMNVSNNLLIPYAACLIIDLYKIHDSANNGTSAYYVNIRYHNETDVEPYNLTVTGCLAFNCPLDTFYSLIKSKLLLSVKDHQIACGLPYSCPNGSAQKTFSSKLKTIRQTR